MVQNDEGFFSARDNLRLFWESHVPDSPKAHVAIIHGYGDHAGRYRRTSEALVKDGFGVHAFDYRGHGQADGRRGYADKWRDFVSDLELFLEKAKTKASGKKLFVLAHSHGGLMMVI
ncbi:MAG: alpha/beta fold hydrolase [Myxococcaceae bacterium]